MALKTQTKKQIKNSEGFPLIAWVVLVTSLILLGSIMNFAYQQNDYITLFLMAAVMVGTIFGCYQINRPNQ